MKTGIRRSNDSKTWIENQGIRAEATINRGDQRYSSRAKDGAPLAISETITAEGVEGQSETM